MNTKNGSKAVKKKNKNRILTQNSDFSQRTDGGNIFLDSSQQYIDSMNLKNKLNGSNIQKKPYEDFKYLQKDKNLIQKQIQIKDEQNGKLSFLDSLKFYSGHLTKEVSYPYKKYVAINNENIEENIQNKRILKQKYHQIDDQFSYTQQYYQKNSLKVSFFVTLLHLFYHFFITSWDLYLYLAITIVNIVVQQNVFQNNSQFTAQPIILIAISVFYIVVKFLCEFIIITRRENIAQNQEQYKVYSNDEIQQQWKITKSAQIKPGYIYKVTKGKKVPTDSLLLHANKSIILVEQNQQQNHGKNLTIKEMVIKQEQLKLPISGILECKVQANLKQNIKWIKGKIQLQEPKKISYSFGHQNILLMNSVNTVSNQGDLICLAINCGNDSFSFNSVGYPYLWKQHYELLLESNKNKSIQKVRVNFLLIGIGVYLILIGVGILVGYVSKDMIKDHPYLQDNLNLLKLLFYHATNFIIFIPILVSPSLLIYQILMTKITETNIKNRKIEIKKSQSQNHENKSQNSNYLSEKNLQKQGNTVLSTCEVTFKDHSLLSCLCLPQTLVLGTQIFKQNQHQSLKLIHLKDFTYDFQNKNLNYVQQLYSKQQISQIKSFLSVSLLAFPNNFSQKDVSHFETLKKSAHKNFSLIINQNKQEITVSGPLEEVFSQSRLSLIPFFTIQKSNQFPFSINFYQIPEQRKKQNQQSRVIAIVKGDPQTLLNKVYDKKIKILVQSQKLRQQKGLQVEIIGKFSCFYYQAQNLKKLSLKSTTQKIKFYNELESHLCKIEPMGLLAFQNQYGNQENKFLNNFFSGYRKNNFFSDEQIEKMRQFPNLILINSHQKFDSHREQGSIIKIKSILGNKNLFDFSQNQIVEKILYDPIPTEQMLEKLGRQKVLVWNGWSQQNIQLMLNELKNKLALMAVIEKEHELYLTKLCQYSVSIGNQNHTQNYVDLTIKPEEKSHKSVSLLTLISILNYDTHIVKQGLQLILLTQITKFICYFVVQCINLAFTLGTGISLIRIPLYLLTQIVVFLDIFYHLNWKDQMQISNKLKDSIFQQNKFSQSWWFHTIKSLCYCLLGSLLIIYSSVKPDNQVSSVFCILHVHFFVTHLLIFAKVFHTKSISLYKLIIIAIQFATYYIGIAIIDKVSIYQFNGILNFMFTNKLFLISVVSLWIFSSCEFIISAFIGPAHKVDPKTTQNQYKQVKRINMETNLEQIQVQTL